MNTTATASWLYRDLLFGINWYSALTALLALLLVGASALLVRHLFGRIILEARHRRRYRRPIQMLADAARGPALLLVWSFGTAAALHPLLEGFTQPDGSNPAQTTIAFIAHMGAVSAAVWLTVQLARGFNRRLTAWARHQSSAIDRFVLPLLARSLPVVLPIVALFASLPLLTLPEHVAVVAGNVAAILLILAIAWTLLQITNTLEKVLLFRFRIDVADNLRARRVYTQVAVLRKVIVLAILLLTVASILMVFETMRQFGTSLLASAGVAGIVLGLAAQRVLGNVIAGFQIAVTQPIRIDDAVVVEDEWGWVEELTLTYVVIRLWDLRRLVLPITYFIEHPFQNWTRTNSELIGTVYLYLDYSVPMDVLRRELLHICEETPLWDGKVAALQVTDTREYVVEVRALASAASGGEAWELRCLVREKMIAFLHRHYPHSLPRFRTQPQTPPPSAD